MIPERADSPNGKRWGRRDARGVITEAYGLDLSPLSARTEEFERLHVEVQQERALCARLRRQITIARRMVHAMLEVALSTPLSGPWAQFRQLCDAWLAKKPRRSEGSDALRWFLDGLEAIRARIEGAYLEATETVIAVDNITETREEDSPESTEMAPRRSNTDPHIQPTNKLQSVTCKATGEESGNARAKMDSSREEEGGHAEEDARKISFRLDLRAVMQACPEFLTWAQNLGGRLKDWGDLHRAAGHLGRMIGITDAAWAATQERLGPLTATAALMLVFDKHCTGEVSTPGGYLRGMIRKAGAGELHLERSFHGRLAAQVA